MAILWALYYRIIFIQQVFIEIFTTYQTVPDPMNAIVKITWKSHNLMNDIDSCVNMETQYKHYLIAWW